MTNIQKKLNNHNHEKYIDTSKFNALATKIFNERLAQANLITKTDFNTKFSNLNKKILKVNRNIYLLKMN